MKINHLGIAVRNIDISAKRYRDSLGWKKDSDKVTDPIQKVHVLFMRDDMGNRYELLESAGNDSPINTILQKRNSLYHFCYEVNDINIKIKELTEKGFLLISGPAEAVAFNGKLIAFLINWDNLIIELVEN